MHQNTVNYASPLYIPNRDFPFFYQFVKPVESGGGGQGAMKRVQTGEKDLNMIKTYCIKISIKNQ